jgi:hypothetical protein
MSTGWTGFSDGMMDRILEILISQNFDRMNCRMDGIFGQDSQDERDF